VAARRLALGTLALFTGASLVSNEAHALGWFDRPAVGLLAVAGAVPVVAVLLATDLLVGAVAVLAPALDDVMHPEVETKAQPVVEEAPEVEVAEEPADFRPRPTSPRPAWRPRRTPPLTTTPPLPAPVRATSSDRESGPVAESRPASWWMGLGADRWHTTPTETHRPARAHARVTQDVRSNPEESQAP
jgi:hypothetical protein